MNTVYCVVGHLRGVHLLFLQQRGQSRYYGKTDILPGTSNCCVCIRNADGICVVAKTDIFAHFFYKQARSIWNINTALTTTFLQQIFDLIMLAKRNECIKQI